MKTTLRRILRILKYMPVLVIVLLVVAWVVSIFRLSSAGGSVGKYSLSVILVAGSLNIALIQPVQPLIAYFRSSANWPENGLQLADVTGYFQFIVPPNSDELFSLSLPLPLIIAAILSLAIGPFLSFRFRLWHYLAYTALVAVELAYYFRWQE